MKSDQKPLFIQLFAPLIGADPDRMGRVIHRHPAYIAHTGSPLVVLLPGS
jgi:hypothetical protein